MLVFIVGGIGGFFGMGGGWAITPSLNLGMGLPLKLAAANSGVILGIGSCVSIWPYIGTGSIIPLFVLPWLAGQVIGGFIGSYALARARVKIIRYILIGIMVFTAFGLITKGLNLLNLMGNIPALVQVIFFTAVFACVIATVISNSKKEKAQQKKEDLENTNIEPLQPPQVHIPASEWTYASIIHWITLAVSIAALFMPIFVLVNPSNNMLNPNTIFGAIFSGASSAEIWSMTSTGGFPGAHFYLQNITKTDSWAMLIVNIGCAVGLFAAVPTLLIHFFKEKKIVDGCLSGALATLMLFAVLGIV
jgi:hypothetical protein